MINKKLKKTTLTESRNNLLSFRLPNILVDDLKELNRLQKEMGNNYTLTDTIIIAMRGLKKDIEFLQSQKKLF
jgi:hypothetical protein